MTSAIGWYGPLIHLSEAALHVGDFVQLLVFVHRSTPVQYKLSKGGEVIRTEIQVGDNTRPFFSVSLWQKQMGSMALAGHVILLQNVKITKFGGFLEATTVQCSSLQCLIHPHESLLSKGVDDLIASCRVGITTKEKLRKVIEWLQRSGSTLCNINSHSNQQKGHFLRNWKVLEEKKSRDCFSLSEVSSLSNSCKAVFHASVGEIFLPFTQHPLDDSEKEKMFISRRLYKTGDNSLVEDLICTGCQLCGSPLDLEYGAMFEKNSIPLYCSESSNRLHAVSLIYRPFMLYVWDESEYLPLLVKNKAAEILFGNIRAARVHLCYREQKQNQHPDPTDVHKDIHFCTKVSNHPKAVAGLLGSCSSDAEMSLELKGKQCSDKKMNLYFIWLIFLKMLLEQGKNSPLKFEVTVNASLDRENGRFQMVSMLMPCFRAK
ncbi:LOC100273399 isoform [Fagus crenata]